MHPSPTSRKPDPDRSNIVLDGLHPRNRDDADLIAILPLGSGNLERVALPGVGAPQKLGQPCNPVFIPRSARRVEPIVVVNEPQPQNCPVRGVTLDPCRRVQQIRVNGGKKARSSPSPLGTSMPPIWPPVVPTSLALRVFMKVLVVMVSPDLS